MPFFDKIYNIFYCLIVNDWSDIILDLQRKMDDINHYLKNIKKQIILLMLIFIIFIFSF